MRALLWFVGRKLAGVVATVAVASLVIYGALYAAPGVGHFAIGDAEGVSLQRYELVDGRFVPGAELSLQAYGVTSLGAQAVLFASPTLATYLPAGIVAIVRCRRCDGSCRSPRPCG